MYAIVETGGKQYKVRVGQIVDVERLDATPGDQVTFDRVLMVSDDGNTKIGTPILESARVLGRVVDQVRGSKVIVFKYRPKQRYRVKRGHRQNYTRVKIESIEA